MRITLLLTAALLGAPQVQSADPPPSIEKLIEGLGSRSFAQRERATKALRERGPEVLPALRKALESKDEEVRKRAESLIPGLEIDEALLPRRVSLGASATSVAAVIAELNKQTGYKIELDVKSRPFASPLTVTDAPFWDVMEQLARATDQAIEYDSTPRNDTQKTIRAHAAATRSPFVNIRGPFRLQANWFHEDRDVDLGKAAAAKDGARGHRLTLSVSVLAEPRITFLKIGPAKVDEALDADGQSVLETEPSAMSATGRGTFRGESLQWTDVRLRRASEGAKSLKVVRGSIPVRTILIRKPVVVTNKVLESTGTRFRAGTAGLEITRVTNQGGGSVEVQIAVPREENQNWEWHERFHLEDDAGNRFQDHGRGSSSNGRQYWISLYYGPPFNNKKVGPPTRLVLEDWVIHDHAISFEFKDVPLP